MTVPLRQFQGLDGWLLGVPVVMGGESSGVCADLIGGVTDVFANRDTVVALKDDGSVVVLGDLPIGCYHGAPGL